MLRSDSRISSVKTRPVMFSSVDEPVAPRRGRRALLPGAEPVRGRASYYVRLWTPLAKLGNRAKGNGRVRPAPAEGEA